jgi:hypothetical protein
MAQPRPRIRRREYGYQLATLNGNELYMSPPIKDNPYVTCPTLEKLLAESEEGELVWVGCIDGNVEYDPGMGQGHESRNRQKSRISSLPQIPSPP